MISVSHRPFARRTTIKFANFRSNGQIILVSQRAGAARRVRASEQDGLSGVADTNQLQTLLKLAVQQEDFIAAAQLRDQLQKVTGPQALRGDWQAAGLPLWLADRLERLGYTFPTEVQKRSLPALLSGNDTVITAATGSGKTLAFVAPCLAVLDYPPVLYPDDLQAPQLVIVVPTLELGAQISLLIFEIYGGNLKVTQPGDPANMYTYQGPKGIKVKGVLNKEELVMAQATTYLRHTHVVVGTPACLAELCKTPGAPPILQQAKVVAVDEADECFRIDPDAMGFLLTTACSREAVSFGKPQVVLVGATLTQQDVTSAVGNGWLRNVIKIGAEDLGVVPPRMQHRFVVCSDASKLSSLVRLLRADLAEMSSQQLTARAIIFMDTEQEVAAATEPLRSTLWTEHKLSVLLPKGEEPLRALQAFREQQATLMLCTPHAARGLDLPDVTHIYNVGLPASTAEYVHRAGRAGRIGSLVPTTVTTLVCAEDVEQLRQLVSSLGVTLVEYEPPMAPPAGESDVDAMRKNLDDLFMLY